MHTNRLINEKSPYLQQHAHNPVDWYPWGTEAFDRARREDKPIFLSVGYSTCHWCHVMERESFESEPVAALLNRHFVPVKVDREERPDVDRIYMLFVQATTGSGGWPMSVWLTPELEPFYGGTYFPPDSRYGRPGFSTLLERLAEAWAKDRAQIRESGRDVVRQLRQHLTSDGGRSSAGDAAIESCFNICRRSFDTGFGGFGAAPKFPRPTLFNFLLRYHYRTGNPEALRMTLDTLRAMSRGGIRDHLGGGFHRYSVDERWFLPHFEKMLYDQAQLAAAFLEAFQITADPFFAAIAREILDYVLRDLASAEGGFYSAEDADSIVDPERPEHKGEGAFYVWRRREIESVLGGPLAAEFCRHYGVRANGNVDNDPHQEFLGANILWQTGPEEDAGPLAEARARLLEVRNRRPRPHLDTKVLTAWNGLMISAFAKGAQVLADGRYLQAARRASDFLRSRMFDPAARLLLRRYRDGEAAVPGFLDDYAFFVQAQLDLYETDFDAGRLDLALSLTARMREVFEDPAGGFFNTAGQQPDLLLRIKDEHDGAEPSGNSIAALNLLRLARMTGRPELAATAARTLEAFGPIMNGSPVSVPQMLVALMWERTPPRQIVVAGDDPARLLAVIRRKFLPHTVVLKAGEALQGIAPDAARMKPLEAGPAAYVCEDFACQLPETDAERLAGLLK